MPDIGDGDSPAGAGRPSVVSFDDAYRLHADLLREIAEKKFRVPTEDAQALVNDVFTAYLLRKEIIREPRKWLIGAVCHASRGYWRAAGRTEPLPADIHERADPAGNLEDHLVRNLTLGLALSRMGKKCRCTLRMYYAEGYSAAEIAAELDTTPGYVMQLLHTCRKRARDLFLSMTWGRRQ